MMRRLVRHLARRSASDSKESRTVGRKIRIQRPEGLTGRLEIDSPIGERIVPAPETTDANAPLVFVPRAIGHYQALDTSEAERVEVPELAMTVYLDPKESHVETIPLDEFLASLAHQGSENENEDSLDALTPQNRVGVWSTLLFCVILLLLAETVLGTRRSLLKRFFKWGVVNSVLQRLDTVVSGA